MYPPQPNRSRSTRAKGTGLISFELIYPNGYNPKTVSHPTYNYLSLFEECFSQDNPGWRHSLGGKSNVGGPFSVYRNKVVSGMSSINIVDVRKWKDDDRVIQIDRFEGPVLPSSIGDLPFPPAVSSDEGQMNRWGAECVAKAAPGTSPMNLAVSLGELKKDGIPSMIGSTFKKRSGVAKAAGDEYLNAQFGWAPLVKDVKSLAKTMTSADEILDQLERDSGSIVRRRLTLKDEWVTTSDEHIGDSFPTVAGGSSSQFRKYYPSGELWLKKEEYRKVWFSGSFTYFLPSDYYARGAIRGGAARTRVLYGLDLNPTTLWNLAPWSWAADWFSNADEVISNTTRFLSEGLVMHHGYLMEHTIHQYTYYSSQARVPALVLQTETKNRVEANPFGFGVEFPDLSGFQTSILAALGLSRSKR